MSANIFGDRFLGHREPAWHSLGNTFADAITAVEAVKRCNLDFIVEKQPVFVHINTPFGVSVEPVEGKFAVVRQPTNDDPAYRTFGIVGAEYGITQNTEIAQALDILTTDWPVETCGALGKGETLFFTLDAGMVKVAGEDLHQYFLVSDFKSGGTAMKIAFTPVRVVCCNTLITGLRSAAISANLTHYANVKDVFKFRIELMGKLQKARATTLESFEALAKTAITADEADMIFAAAYPYPNVPAKAAAVMGMEKDDQERLGELMTEAQAALANYEYYVGRMNAFRDGARQLFQKINDEHMTIANSAWGAYNAVAELADFREGADSVPVSSLFGWRAQEKSKAFASAMTLVKP